MFLTLVCKETNRLYLINKKIILETKPLRFKDFISKYSLSTQLIKASQFVHIEGIPFQNNKRALKKDVNNNLTYHDTESRVLFFKNWQGNWSVSQWNHTQKELIIARDKFGTKSIYYYDCPHYFVYTDTLDKLLNLPFIPKELNPSKLIQLGANGREDGRTFFKKINQLPKAHYIKLVNGKVSLNNYWLPSYKATLHYNNHSDYVDNFNEIYSQVIRENVEGFKHPSIALSSGLDSGSMYAIAAPYLKNKNQPLSVLTWHTNVVDERFNLPNRIKDETLLVKELIRPHSNTRFSPTASQFGNILSSYRKIISSNHQPIVDLQSHIMEVFEKGHEIGVDVMLNGFEGNFTVSHTGHPTICRSNALDSLRALKSRLRKTARFLLAQSGNSAFKNTSRDYIRKEAVADNLSQYQPLTAHLEGIRKKEDGRFSHRQTQQ